MTNNVTDKGILSGSTDGKWIKVVATATAGTTIHTWPTDTATFHEVWLYAYNTSTSAVKLTIEFGWTTSPDDTVEVTIPPEAGAYLVIPWRLLKGNATPLVVRAFAASANVVIINGYYHLIA